MKLLQPLGSVVLVLAAGSIRCGGGSASSTQQASLAPKPTTVTLTAGPLSPPSLSYPPAPRGRRARGPNPIQTKAPPKKLLATHPRLDDADEFLMDGKAIVVAFNRDIVGATAGAPAGEKLLFEPAVAGQARWLDKRTIEFVAHKYLDPAKLFRLRLSGVKAQDGQSLDAYRASFRSTTAGILAGKSLTHVPKPGLPRLVAGLPRDEANVAPRARFSLLFDQPVDVAAIRPLVELRNGGGLPIGSIVSHPPVDRFGHARMNRRHVIIVQPRSKLQPGGYSVHVDSALPPPDATEQRFDYRVVDGFSVEQVHCGWWTPRNALCAMENSVLKTSQGAVRFELNNPVDLSDARLKAHVRVAPTVRNLRITNESWSERGNIVVKGDFRPSTSYRITIGGLKDRYGQLLSTVSQKVEMASLGSSVSMPEGLVTLDKARTKRFLISSRNMNSAQLRLWRVPQDDPAAFRAAYARLSNKSAKAATPDIVVPIAIAAKRDELVETAVDLSSHLAAEHSYVTELVADAPAFGAAAAYPAGSPAARPPLALLRRGDDKTLAVHLHSVPGATLVQLSRLGGGEPVAGASVSVLDEAMVGPPAALKTDPSGVVVLAADTREGEGLVRVEAGEQVLFVPLNGPHAGTAELFPELSGGIKVAGATRAQVITDRGIYRPGARVEIKTSAFEQRADRLVPLANRLVQVQALGPDGHAQCSSQLTTSALGGASYGCKIGADAKLGLHRIQLKLVAEDGGAAGAVVAEAVVRIAEFEAPRFKVDVSGSVAAVGQKRVLQSRIKAQYLFGAAMDGAPVKWSLKRSAASFPRGPLTDAGLGFESEPSWMDDEQQEERWTRTGESKLDGSGELALSQPLKLGAQGGPQRFTLEADVSDASYRHAAGRRSVIVHPARRYAGIRNEQRWVGTGEDVQVQLGVMDRDGHTVTGARVSAKLVRVQWRYVGRRGPGNALVSEWRTRETEVARCSVTSADKPLPCTLTVGRSGDYRIVSEVDGRAGGGSWLWAWGDADDSDASAVPSKGNVVQLVADKGRYKVGDTAKVLARNPYPAATAILTTEMGGLVSHQSKRVKGSAVAFDVPIHSGHTPHVHATVTLLPIGARDAAAASYRVGALRLPVDAAGSRLTVAVRSSKTEYRPGEKAEITVTVQDQGKPEANAEVALALVDEGVLRLTNFHAADPQTALRPPLPLDIAVRDTRTSLADLMVRSHVAGDGGGLDEKPDTRRKFVKTALWKPLLRTNSNGQATVAFTLPDNLTEFRMMAVVVDDEGKGGRRENSFRVTQPLLVEPLLPRFASLGDEFSVAAMVHNNSAKDFEGTLDLAGSRRKVKLAAGKRTRVEATMRASTEGKVPLLLQLKDLQGEVQDSVQRALPVRRAGVAQAPTLFGSFDNTQEVKFALPAGIDFKPGAMVSIQVGKDLWPELGKRMEYLLDYPHGCVEQTTSSTLPLLAARTMLPQLGIEHHDEAFFRDRITAGLKRLASMRTPSGGLAYWPGGNSPHVYGSAYAFRAIQRAKDAGITPPAGLWEGLRVYLGEALVDPEQSASLRANIAASLAGSTTPSGATPSGATPDGATPSGTAVDSAFPASMADSLYAARSEMDTFGKASLALALATLPGQDDRIAGLLHDVTADFDGKMTLLRGVSRGYFGSPSRSMAQTAIALTKLQPDNPLLQRIVDRLAERTDDYTTQRTAYSLLALADHLQRNSLSPVEINAALDGAPVTNVSQRDGMARFEIPIAELSGKQARLTLANAGSQRVTFRVQGRYRVPLDAIVKQAGAAASVTGAKWQQGQSAGEGADVFRLITNEADEVVDPAHIKAGELLRVTLLVRLDAVAGRREYLAITDPLPGGFEPIQPELSSVTTPPDVSINHPLARWLLNSGEHADHVELRDDRVQLYFDRVNSDTVVASYLVRATTPGRFALPPTTAELMYVPNSTSYGDAAEVVIK